MGVPGSTPHTGANVVLTEPVSASGYGVASRAFDGGWQGDHDIGYY